MKNIIIASTSTVFGGKPLDYLLEELKVLFQDTSDILFIPYARPSGISHDDYTSRMATVFSNINKTVKGIHEFKNAPEAIKQAKGIFIGGGNTFVLVSQLYKNDCINNLKTAINNGIPYLGTSAGSNICGLTMSTTNDMPVVYPPSFKTLGFVPFNINPHYLDPVENSKHMGETRETRINEFHHYNTQPVIGLREGSWIRVKSNEIQLKGTLKARVFEYEQDAYEIETNTFLNELK
jgi:dipeptidase E